MKWILTWILLGTYYLALAQHTIPVDRLTDWGHVGYNGDTTISYQVVLLENYFSDTLGQVDQSPILQNLLTQQQVPTEYIFPKGHFLFKSTLQIPSYTKLTGQGSGSSKLLFDMDKAGHCLSSTGNGLNGNSCPLTDSVFKGQHFIRTDSSAPLFYTGEILYLVDDDHNFMHNSWAYGSSGQYLTVDVHRNDTLFVLEPIRRAYAPLLNASLTKANMNREVHIRCLKLERLDQWHDQKSNVFFSFTSHSTVSGIASSRCDYAHVETRYSKNITIEGSYFNKGISYGRGGKAYGTLLHLGSCDVLVQENNFDHLRHSMLLQAGANGNVLIFNYSTEPHWTEPFIPSNSAGDLVLHGNYPYMNLMEGNVVQNIVIDNSHGASGPYNTFFRNRAESYGFVIMASSGTHSQNVIGNEIPNLDPFKGLYHLPGADHYEYGNFVRGHILPSPISSLNTSSLYSMNHPLSSFIGFPHIPGSKTIPVQALRTEGLFTSCHHTSTLGNTYQGTASQSVILYPNPVNSTLNLEGMHGKVSVIDLRGKKILDLTKNQNEISLDVGFLIPGTYLLRIEDDQQSFTKIFIKQ